LHATHQSVLQEIAEKWYVELSLTSENSGDRETSGPLRYSSISAITLNLWSQLSQGLLLDEVSGIGRLGWALGITL